MARALCFNSSARDSMRWTVSRSPIQRANFLYLFAFNKRRVPDSLRRRDPGSGRPAPRGAGIGLEDLSGALRQQQILGHGQRSRTSGRGSCLCRPYCDPPGRTHRCRASAFIRPRRDDLRSLALRAGAGAQARRLA